MVSLLKNNKNPNVPAEEKSFPKGRVSKFDNPPKQKFFKCGGFGPYEIHRNGK